MTFSSPDQFWNLVLFYSGSSSDRLALFRKRELLDGLARAKMWLADGAFKLVQLLFFLLYTMHFELVSDVNSAAGYCFLQNKTHSVYAASRKKIIGMIPLLDFESAAIDTFREAYPNARNLPDRVQPQTSSWCRVETVETLSN